MPPPPPPPPPPIPAPNTSKPAPSNQSTTTKVTSNKPSSGQAQSGNIFDEIKKAKNLKPTTTDDKNARMSKDLTDNASSKSGIKIILEPLQPSGRPVISPSKPTTTVSSKNGSPNRGPPPPVSGSSTTNSNAAPSLPQRSAHQIPNQPSIQQKIEMHRQESQVSERIYRNPTNRILSNRASKGPPPLPSRGGRSPNNSQTPSLREQKKLSEAVNQHNQIPKPSINSSNLPPTPKKVSRSSTLPKIPVAPTLVPPISPDITPTLPPSVAPSLNAVSAPPPLKARDRNNFKTSVQKPKQSEKATPVKIPSFESKKSLKTEENNSITDREPPKSQSDNAKTTSGKKENSSSFYYKFAFNTDIPPPDTFIRTKKVYNSHRYLNKEKPTDAPPNDASRPAVPPPPKTPLVSDKSPSSVAAPPPPPPPPPPLPTMKC